MGSTLPETDTESVDLNDMDDAEAERLDVALSTAFKLLKKPATGNNKKKSKIERATQTTVMHFRIRCLELLEIYLKTNPTMSITLEIMLALFNMIEFCTTSDLQSLSVRVDRVLKRLLGIRSFETIDDVSEQQLAELIKSLVEKKVNPVMLSQHNQLLSKSFAFVISNSQQLTKPNSKKSNSSTLDLILEYAKEFVRSRNPSVQFNLLQDIFKIRWTGVWQIAQCLAETGLQLSTRSFRRSQVMELLAQMYKNHGFLTQHTDPFNKINRLIEKTLQTYLTFAQNLPQFSPKEFTSVVSLLCEMHRCHKMQTFKTTLNWTQVGTQIQDIRKKVVLVSIQAYATFCRYLGLKLIKKVENGHAEVAVPVSAETVDSDEPTQNGTTQHSDDKQNRKRKTETATTVDNKKQKKLKKTERLRIASAGFNGFSFGNVSTKELINSDEDVDAVQASSNEDASSSDED